MTKIQIIEQTIISLGDVEMFDSHAFIKRLSEEHPSLYGEYFSKNDKVNAAHGQIASYLRRNEKKLGITKVGEVLSIDVFGNLNINSLWRKVKPDDDQEQQGKKVEKEVPHIGLCVECERCYVMSDGVKDNPLIIECPINKIRYPQSWPCTNNSFIRRVGEMIIHPMIYLNRKDPSLE